MLLLLDIDGVMETSPAWKTPQFLADGFYQFNAVSQENLKEIVAQFQPEIVLTTTHRVNYTLEEWRQIFKSRSIDITKISKINEAKNSTELRKRNVEIEAWFDQNEKANFIILDDDKSLYALPKVIKDHWIRIDPLLGITSEVKQELIKRLTQTKE